MENWLQGEQLSIYNLGSVLILSPGSKQLCWRMSLSRPCGTAELGNRHGAVLDKFAGR